MKKSVISLIAVAVATSAVLAGEVYGRKTLSITAGATNCTPWTISKNERPTITRISYVDAIPVVGTVNVHCVYSDSVNTNAVITLITAGGVASSNLLTTPLYLTTSDNLAFTTVGMTNGYLRIHYIQRDKYGQ